MSGSHQVHAMAIAAAALAEARGPQRLSAALAKSVQVPAEPAPLTGWDRLTDPAPQGPADTPGHPAHYLANKGMYRLDAMNSCAWMSSNGTVTRTSFHAIRDWCVRTGQMHAL